MSGNFRFEVFEHINFFLDFLETVAPVEFRCVLSRGWESSYSLGFFLEREKVPGITVKPGMIRFRKRYGKEFQVVIELFENEKRFHAGINFFRFRDDGFKIGELVVARNGLIVSSKFDYNYIYDDKECAANYVPSEFLDLLAQYNMCQICEEVGATPRLEPADKDEYEDHYEKWGFCTHPGFYDVSEMRAVRDLVYISRHVPGVNLETGVAVGKPVVFLRVLSDSGSRREKRDSQVEGIEGSRIVFPDPLAVISDGTLWHPCVRGRIAGLAQEVRDFRRNGNDTPSCLLDWIGDELADLFMP